MSITHKIWATFLALLLVMGLVGFAGLSSVQHLNTEIDEVYRAGMVRADGAHRILETAQQIRIDVLNHVITSDPATKTGYDRTIAHWDTRIDEAMAGLSHSTDLTPDEIKYLSDIQTAWGKYRQDRTDTLRLSREGRLDDALGNARGEAARSFSDFQGVLVAFLSLERELANTRYEASSEIAKSLTTTVATVAVLSPLFLLFLWWYINRSIASPLRTAAIMAEQIANGDLDRSLEVKGDDEIGRLATQFNEMAEKLREMYGGLEEKVRTRTEELQSANQTLNARQQELKFLNEELTRSDRVKSRFLAMASHELRTPLNSLIGFAELLKDGAHEKLSDEQRRFLEHIDRSARHLLNLVNSILDLAKVDAGRMTVHAAPFNLRETCREMSAMMSTQATARGVTLAMHCADICESNNLDALIVSDETLIRQIMLNLMGNAVKFTPAGGRVDITVSLMEEEADMRSFRIMVVDTGIGIKPTDLDRIFGEFEQVEGAPGYQSTGTGLGLNLTRKLVKLLGGAIDVTSEYGAGSTFTVVLPVSTLKMASAPLTGADQGDLEEEVLPLILLVDDDRQSVAQIEQYLKDGGYRVETAHDTGDALNKAVELNPFAIALNIMLRSTDGWELLSDLKRLKETRAIPVIVVSPSGEGPDAGFSMGPVGFLEKPFGRQALLDNLKGLSFASGVKHRPFTVLVVDDDPLVRDLLSTILEGEGFGVLTAAGGDEGIRMAIDRNPDLLILDLMMPEVDGFCVVGHLREHPRAQEIPILVLTAKNLTPKDKEALNHSVVKILHKGGVSNGDLLSEIQRVELMFPARAGLIDGMTKTYNSRYLSRRLSQEIGRGRRYGRMFSALRLDIDRFREYNRAHGVENGNEVLRQLAILLGENIRKADPLIRSGGDEFTVLLPDTSKESAILVGEKLRIRVEKCRFMREGESVPSQITASVAVASYPVDGLEASMLLQGLDTAVNGAAGAGGNRVMRVGI